LRERFVTAAEQAAAGTIEMVTSLAQRQPCRRDFRRGYYWWRLSRCDGPGWRFPASRQPVLGAVWSQRQDMNDDFH